MTQTSSGELQFGVLPLDYPKAHIRMSIETEMEAKYRRTACEKEPWTVEFIEQQEPGTWFIDVGANVGAYTLVAVACGLRVLAIEPDIVSAKKLVDNLQYNDWADRAIVIQCAVAERPGFDYFSPADLRPGYNDHVYRKHKHELQKRPDIFHTRIISTFRLDDLLPLLGGDDPMVLKIDVDGGEEAVLAGAAESLQNGRVRGMMLELHRKHAEKLLTTLTGFGWKEVRRIDENSDLTPGEKPKFGRERFRDMFYVQLERG